MAKPNINSYQDLIDEKARLKANLTTRKVNMLHSFDALKHEFNPFAKLKDTTSEMMRANTTNPIVKFGIKRASEFLIGKILLKRAGWITRLVVPFAVREITTRVVGRKADKKIADTLKTAADKIRDIRVPNLVKHNASKANTL